MTELRATQRARVRTNRAGNVAAVLANVVGLVLIHVWPGWEAIPFLTEDTPSVLGLVDAALVVGIVVNVVYLVRDPGWPTAAGQLITTVMSTVAMVRVLQVFPFDLSGAWTTVVRALLLLAIVGSCLGIIALVVALSRLRRVEGR
jgi:hypothetical protein